MSSKETATFNARAVHKISPAPTMCNRENKRLAEELPWNKIKMKLSRDIKSRKTKFKKEQAEQRKTRIGKGRMRGRSSDGIYNPGSNLQY